MPAVYTPKPCSKPFVGSLNVASARHVDPPHLERPLGIRRCPFFLPLLLGRAESRCEASGSKPSSRRHRASPAAFRELLAVRVEVCLETAILRSRFQRVLRHLSAV